MPCVSEAAVLGFLHDTLEAGQRQDFERHLDACSECLELVTLASRTSLAASPAAGAPPAASAGELSPGTRIGRYEIDRPLGRGAMGMVYAARDTQLGRRIAIKLVHPRLATDPPAQLALLREAQALARITQPNVLTVYDVGAFDDTVFLAAELVDGDTLDVWLARPRRWRQIVEVFLQAARGLEAAHAVGVVHRDFKPSNAIVGRDRRVRVFDFGVARLADAGAPGRELAGTPLYMSPEQLRGDVADARSDQYALCVALHEALFGEHPVLRTPAALPPSRVIGRPPGWLRDILRRGLAPEPDRRFPSLAALRGAVKRGLARRRRWLVAGVAATAVAAAAITAGLGYVRGVRAPLERCPEPALPSWSVLRPGVARALRDTALPYAPSVAARVDRVLDQFAARWQHQARDVCLATAVAGADELAARRTACLARDRDVFVAIAERFAAADRALVGRADQLLGALPDLDACAHADPPASPADPHARARLAHHFAEIARVRSLAEAGQLDEAARRAEQLARDAPGLGVRRAEADASYLTGHIADLRGQFDEAARRVEQALWIAEATRYDELAATAASELVFLIGNRQRRPAEARPFVELARAAAERLGSAAARARAARVIGNLEVSSGNVDAAGAALGEALALSQDMSPPDPLLTAVLLMDLANVDRHRGQHASAEQRLRQAAGTIARELGELHPLHAQVLNNLANTLLALGRADEAAPVFDRVTAIQQRALGPDR